MQNQEKFADIFESFIVKAHKDFANHVAEQLRENGVKVIGIRYRDFNNDYFRSKTGTVIDFQRPGQEKMRAVINPKGGVFYVMPLKGNEDERRVDSALGSKHVKTLSRLITG